MDFSVHVSNFILQSTNHLFLSPGFITFLNIFYTSQGILSTLLLLSCETYAKKDGCIFFLKM